MTEKASTDQLIGVPETMMIPLYARAMETQRADGIIRDEKAVEMMARIDYDFSRFAGGDPTILGIAIRTEVLDEKVNAFIAKNPDALIINIAAGLDTRFERVDNGRILWVDLDLPESIAIRRQFITPSDRQHFIASDALDFTWFDQVEAWVMNLQDRAVMLILEGLLMYFDEADVKRLLVALAKRFPSAEVLLEVTGVSMAKKQERQIAVNKTSAHFKWGIRHTQDMELWDSRIQVVEDVSIYDRYETRWLAMDLSFPAPLKDLRNTTLRIVHVRFGEPAL
ncbi:MAG: class I SAM-dependent methyltransferase [Aggregatilineales bacterium]